MKTLDEYDAIVRCKKDYLRGRTAANSSLLDAEKEYTKHSRLLSAEAELRDRRAAIACQINEFSNERVRNKIKEELYDIEERLFASARSCDSLDHNLIDKWQKELDLFEDYSFQLVKTWQRRKSRAAFLYACKKVAPLLYFCAGAAAAHLLMH